MRENVKRHKKRHKRNYTLYYILLLLLLVGTGITLSLTVFFNVEQFEVLGNGALSAEQIIADSGIELGSNLFRVSTDRAERAIIDRNVNIDAVEIHRALPNTLRIEVELSKVAAVVYTDGKYYSLSQGERIIKVSETYEDEGAPLVIGCDFSDEVLGGYVEPGRSNRLEMLLAVLGAIHANEAGEQIRYIDLSSIVTIRMYYGDTTELKFSGITDLDFELSRVLELFELGSVNADEYQIIDATVARENARYFVQPLESSPLPEDFTRHLQPPDTGNGTSVPGYDLPPDQLPPDWDDTPSDGGAE